MPKVGTRSSSSAPDHRHGVFAGRRRVAGAVREEDAVGLERQHLLGGRGRRHDGHLAAGLREEPQDVALDAVVDGDDVVLRLVLAAIALAELPGGLVPANSAGRW